MSTSPDKLGSAWGLGTLSASSLCRSGLLAAAGVCRNMVMNMSEEERGGGLSAGIFKFKFDTLKVLKLFNG